MSKFLKVFFRIYAAICICLIVSVSLVLSGGVIKSPLGLNDDNATKQEQTSSNKDTSSNQNNKNNDIVDVSQVSLQAVFIQMKSIYIRQKVQPHISLINIKIIVSYRCLFQ